MIPEKIRPALSCSAGSMITNQCQFQESMKRVKTAEEARISDSNTDDSNEKRRDHQRICEWQRRGSGTLWTSFLSREDLEIGFGKARLLTRDL